MAVREALTRLLGENLVVFGEKGGYFVKSMTPNDIKEIRELRELLELGRCASLPKSPTLPYSIPWRKYVKTSPPWSKKATSVAPAMRI